MMTQPLQVGVLKFLEQQVDVLFGKNSDDFKRKPIFRDLSTEKIRCYRISDIGYLSSLISLLCFFPSKTPFVPSWSSPRDDLVTVPRSLPDHGAASRTATLQLKTGSFEKKGREDDHRNTIY